MLLIVEHIPNEKTKTTKIKKMDIRQKHIDVCAFKIKNHNDEFHALIELQKQIRRWISENFKQHESEILKTKSSSILLNKLIYYISDKIEYSNPYFVITRGWYRFGPCYNDGRKSEGSLSIRTFPYVKSDDEIIKEVDDVCSEHVNIFWKSINERDDKFPYSYLSYIYKTKVDFPFLKQFYLAKHELLNALYDKEVINDKKKMAMLFMNFDAAISNPEYTQKVALNKKQVDCLMEFTMLLADCVLNYSGKQKLLWEMKGYLEESIIGLFSSKNYINTLKSSNDNYTDILRNHEKKKVELILEDIPKKVSIYQSRLS